MAESLLEDHAAISRAWEQWDTQIFDFDKAGESHHAFHPSGLAKSKELLPLSRFGTDDDYLSSTRAASMVVGVPPHRVEEAAA